MEFNDFPIGERALAVNDQERYDEELLGRKLTENERARLKEYIEDRVGEYMSDVAWNFVMEIHRTEAQRRG